MALYILRSLRYLLRMVILLGLVFAILYFAGLLDTGGMGLAKALFMSKKGLILIAALLLLAIIDPKVSFTTMAVRGDIVLNRDAIEEVMENSNYVPTGNGEGALRYKAGSFARRLFSSFNDEVTVRQDGDYIAIEGLKKNVSRIELRLMATLHNE